MPNKFVFVADYFLNKYLGGAELSTQALIDSCPGEVIELNAGEIEEKDVEAHRDAHWIFTNVWLMKFGMIPWMVKTIKSYSIVEYDFKYCAYRSPDTHMLAEGIECNCRNPMLDIYYGNADNVFFMSQRQMDWHTERIPKIGNPQVLSSIFTPNTLIKLSDLAHNRKEKDSWAIIFSAAGGKGFSQAVEYAERNKKNYYILKGLSYDDLLTQLSQCEGLIYKPICGDTCPRAVIEAFLMGLKLDLNYFVMHKDEEWFRERALAWNYLSSNKSRFWMHVCRIKAEALNA